MTRRRRRVSLAVLGAVLLLLVEQSFPPERQVSALVLLGAIDAYQATLSPVFARSGVRCRFQPTCSHYGEAAIRRHGALRGGWRAVRRVARCGPWTPAGTVDLP